MYHVYKSADGYVGKLYGDTSLSISNARGEIVFRTNKREVNTAGGLKKMVDEFPRGRR